MQKMSKKIIILTLALGIAATVFFARPRNAQSFVSFGGVTWIACLPFDFNCTKEGILDPIATGIVNSMIRQVRAATVNWIISGDFEIKKPFFVTSFIADPQRIADNAARLFLSELTGINFCNFHPNMRTIGTLTLDLNLNRQLSCSFGGNYDAFLNDFDNGGLASLFALRQSGNTFSTSLLDTAAKKEQSVVRATAARLREATLGGGFLGQRDPKTGKIKTPGASIAGTLMGVRNAEDISNSTQKELFSAIVDIIDIAIGQSIQKGLIEPISK